VSPAPDILPMRRLYAGARAVFELHPAPESIDPMTWDRLSPDARRPYVAAAKVALDLGPDLDAAAYALWRSEELALRRIHNWRGRRPRPHPSEAQLDHCLVVVAAAWAAIAAVQT
jgi:hypothetical protein